MRASWLADVLRAAGLTVHEVSGWQSRGREMSAIKGVVLHDTVTTRDWTDASVVRLLRDGRSDLAGPLSQMGLNRQGEFYVVAAGRANHNGYGEPWGNDALGIEVFCAGGLNGREEPWNDVQKEAVAVGTAAILDRLDLPASRCQGHREQDPGRKIDPYGVDLDEQRQRIARFLEEGFGMALSDDDKKWLAERISAASADVPRQVMAYRLADGARFSTYVRTTNRLAHRLVDMVEALASGDVSNARKIAVEVREELANALAE